MAEKHAVVRTDQMSGTDDRSQLVFVMYHESSDPVAIDNGRIVALDGLVEGRRDVYKAVKPNAKTPLSKIALVAAPEMIYEGNKPLTAFYNHAGEAARAYRLQSGFTFSVTLDALGGKGDPAVGDVVEVAADTKASVVDKMTGVTSGSTAIGSIVAIETVGLLKFYVISVY